MVEIRDKAECCGCHACANICPKKCISMELDSEGFLYPFVQKAQCTNCGICEKVCPEINTEADTPKSQWGYVVQHRDNSIRRQSTSGGAFTAIAQQVITEGGVVFGAAFDDNHKVVHKYVESKKELESFRNSKYVQSEIGNTYVEAKAFLNSGRKVCFSGTPCQIEGLFHFLKNPYSNLILVDVMCRAVPSPGVFQLYMDEKKKKFNNKIAKVLFRDKSIYGYKYSQLSMYDKDNNLLYHNGIDTDPWLRAFFSNICDRPSCYRCSFRKRYRVSDITLWDCFEPGRFDSNMDDNKGTTRLLVHSVKGNTLLRQIKSEIYLKEIEPNDLIGNFSEISVSIPIHQRRSEFFEDINKLAAGALFTKYFPDLFSVKFERTMRRAAHKFGFYKVMRSVFKSVEGDKKR